jgi:hypothetical protein
MIGNQTIGEKSVGDTRDVPFLVQAIKTIKWNIDGLVSRTLKIKWNIWNIYCQPKQLGGQ